jgi:protein ImuB
MARSGQPRFTPGVSLLPAPAPSPATREHPRPRLAPGGGRRRGAGDPVPAAPAARELWLAVHLPHYVLESLQPQAAAPVAVVDLERGAKVVCDCDAQAAAAGVVPGMALNSALALQPGLHVVSRDPRRERVLLEAVATAGLDFTSRVNLEPPDAVLLGVRGSLRLFGGARRLCELLRQRLHSRGLAPRLALTPTALASLWFARAGGEVVLRRPDALAARLAPLPLAVTRWPERALQSLATMGVRTVGECLRLPRDGFARRFEPRMRLDLDRALGQAHDPRAAFAAAARFVARRDLEPEVADTDRLQRECEPLLDELCAFLRARGASVEALEFHLAHRDIPATRLRLGFAEPVGSAARITGVLRERLARTALCAPVRAVRLRSGPLVAARAEAKDLFAGDCRGGAAVIELIERLQARLGAGAVHGLRLVPEHRPEKNGDILLFSRALPLHWNSTGKTGECPHFSRPVWLLAEPQRLEGGERPCCEGPLEIEEGPERIESGWWDGRDVQRDYYVARTPAGARLWIFRERRTPGGWFLHGVFG